MSFFHFTHSLGYNRQNIRSSFGYNGQKYGLVVISFTRAVEWRVGVLRNNLEVTASARLSQRYYVKLQTWVQKHLQVFFSTSPKNILDRCQSHSIKTTPLLEQGYFRNSIFGVPFIVDSYFERFFSMF